MEIKNLKIIKLNSKDACNSIQFKESFGKSFDESFESTINHARNEDGLLTMSISISKKEEEGETSSDPEVGVIGWEVDPSKDDGKYGENGDEKNKIFSISCII